MAQEIKIPNEAKLEVLRAEAETARFLSIKSESPEVRAAAGNRILVLNKEIEELGGKAA